MSTESRRCGAKLRRILDAVGSEARGLGGGLLGERRCVVGLDSAGVEEAVASKSRVPYARGQGAGEEPLVGSC